LGGGAFLGLAAWAGGKRHIVRRRKTRRRRREMCCLGPGREGLTMLLMQVTVRGWMGAVYA
jgi:hypothetical protein